MNKVLHVVILWLLCSYTIPSYAQRFIWAQQINDAGRILNEQDKGPVATDSHGNILTTAFFNDSLHFRSGTYHSASFSSFVAKYDSAGNELWVNEIENANTTAITTDKYDNIYVTGVCTNDTTYFTPADFIINDSGSLYQNAFLVKYDPAGHYLWSISTKEASRVAMYGRASINCVAADTSGNVVIGGDFMDSVILSGVQLNGNGLFLAKYSSSGSIVWVKSGNNFVSSFSSLACDKQNNIYANGYTMVYKTILDTDTIVRPGAQGNFIIKYDPSGKLIWVSNSIGNRGQYYNGMATAVDDAGNVYSCGGAQDTLRYYGYVAKHSADGRLVWIDKFVRGHGFALVEGVVLDAIGTPYVIGSYDTLSWPDTTYTVDTESAFIARLDKYTGDRTWFKQPGGPNPSIGLGICIDVNGAINITGLYSTHLQLDSLSFSLPSSGMLGSYFLAHISNSPLAVPVVGQSTMSYLLYPNPVSGMLHLAFLSGGYRHIVVTDEMGQSLMYSATNNNTTDVDMSGFAPGNYFITVVDAGGNKATRMVVKR